MRVFVFLTLAVLSSSSQSNSVVESHRFVDSYDSHVLQRRAAATTVKPTTKTTTAKPTTTTVKSTTTTTEKIVSTTTKKPSLPLGLPDIKTSLTTASQVFTTLGDIKNAQKFAERYLEIPPLRMISALKGVSIGASLLFAILDIPDPETEKILTTMNTNFDKMFKKIDSQTTELKSYIDKKFLNTFVLAPVKTAVDGMYTYKNKSNNANKAAFLEKAKNANLPEVINRILLDQRDVLTNVMISSRYNKTMVAAMSSLLMHNFHKAIIVQSFRNGLEFEGIEDLVDRMETHNQYYTSSVHEYNNTNEEVFATLEDSFFPGFLEDDILKPAIDNNNMNNCQKAESIFKQLSTNYNWRNYVVIVSDDSTNIGYSGFPKRSLVLKPYNGKAVQVFMTTKDFAKTKKEYTAGKEKDKILNKLQNIVTLSGFSELLLLARNQSAYYQLAAYTSQYCLYSSNTNIYEEFKGKYNFQISFSEVLGRDISLITIF